MLKARLPTILPLLTPAELLEVSMVASVEGKIEVAACPIAHTHPAVSSSSAA